MDGDTPRLIGNAIGMALFGYIVLRIVNGPRKKADAKPREADPGSAGRTRRFATLAVVALLAGTAAYWLNRETGAPDFDQHCAAPLRNTAEVEQALQDGYEVDRSRRCISKNGYEEITRRKQARQP